MLIREYACGTFPVFLNLFLHHGPMVRETKPRFLNHACRHCYNQRIKSKRFGGIMNVGEEALAVAREKYSEEVSVRVRSAIDSLVEQGKALSFYSVAEAAGVARSTLYRRDDLRALVEAARSGVRAAAPTSPIADRLADAENENRKLRVDLARLDAAYRKACRERDCLYAVAYEAARGNKAAFSLLRNVRRAYLSLVEDVAA